MIMMSGLAETRSADKTIDVHVSRLRRKLAAFDVAISTRYGEGYSLENADAARLKEMLG